MIQLDPKIGFKIQNGRLPEHNGEIECMATKFNQTDSVRFTLNFIFGPNPVNPVTPPPNCENYRHSDQIIALIHYTCILKKCDMTHVKDKCGAKKVDRIL